MSARWVRKDTPTIMSGLVVRYRWFEASANEPEVNASRDGVSIGGAWPVMTDDEICAVVEILNLARAQHHAIAKSGSARADWVPRDPRKGAFG